MEDLLHIAITASIKAGEEVLSLYTDSSYTLKHDGSPITLADTRSHDVLITHLEKTGITILSEESDGIPLPYPEKLWIIDPIDGTRDFINHSGDFSIMLGLIEHGQPVLGVVNAPALDTLFFATKNGGAFKIHNGITSKLISTQSHSPLQYLCSINHFTGAMETIQEKLAAEKMPRGSAGIKAGLLSEGVGDFFFYTGALGEWDVCGPEIIAREAGALVTDGEGNPITYGTSNHRLTKGIIFSKPDCYKRIHEAIIETGIL